MEISKELLSDIYGFEVKDFVQLGTDDVTYEIRFNGLKNGYKYNIINIYELAHKCKEWAIGNYGFSLHSFPCPDDTYTCEIYKFHKSTGYVIVDWFNCLSENESIFEACEWIRKEINK